MNVFRTIVAVHPVRPSTSANVSGDVRPVEMECGHIAQLNPTFDYKVGARRRCRECERVPA